MIQFFDKSVNSLVIITTKISTTTVPTDLKLYADGMDADEPVDFANLNESGLANFSFIPNYPSVYTLYGDGQVLATVQVTNRSLYNYLEDLEGEALGSWQWDKVTGDLVLLRVDGTPLCHFTVIDNSTVSSRERFQSNTPLPT